MLEKQRHMMYACSANPDDHQDPDVRGLSFSVSAKLSKHLVKSEVAKTEIDAICVLIYAKNSGKLNVRHLGKGETSSQSHVLHEVSNFKTYIHP